MTVKEYVVKMVENSAKYREINVGEEVWNILYNLLLNYNIKHNDIADLQNENLVGYVNSHEEDFIHHYPHIKKTGVKENESM